MSDDKFRDGNKYRCPACGHKAELEWETKGRLIDDEGGKINCGLCDHEFHIEFRRAFTFTSPTMLKESR